MSVLKQQRETSSLQRAIAEFIAQESNRQSLITVTSVELRNRGKEAAVGFTVLPETAEDAALLFLNRKRREIGEFIKTKIAIGFIPKIRFHIDIGQKNTETIIDILRKEEERKKNI